MARKIKIYIANTRTGEERNITDTVKNELGLDYNEDIPEEMKTEAVDLAALIAVTSYGDDADAYTN
jgi:hypothetical protein